MIANNDCRRVALPVGALGLPDIDTKTIRNWVDFGLWGLLFYDDQSPWLALVECLHILHHRKNASSGQLFVSPSKGLDGILQHGQVKYEVPLNFHLRHFLFRDRGTAFVAAHAAGDGSNSEVQWKALIQHTSENWNDSDSRVKLDVSYLQNRFEDVRSVEQTLEVLRSTEIDAHTGKRWTSRHLLPLGPNMLFADVRERSYAGDRRFMRRTGEMLYLMLGRSKPRNLQRLNDLVDHRLVSGASLWNRLAGLFLSCP